MIITYIAETGSVLKLHHIDEFEDEGEVGFNQGGVGGTQLRQAW